MQQDRRASPRETLSLPITLEDGSGAVTRDLSAEGLYLLMPAGRAIGQWVVIEYEMATVRLKFAARGEVLRIDHGPYYTGVAIRMHSPRLIPLN